jgi:hypothetical protein
MSKFVDKLQSVCKASSVPIGFHQSVSEPKSPAMLLIVGLAGTQAKEATIVADVNADAGLVLSEDPSAKLVKQMVEAVGNVPLGVSVKSIDAKQMDELASVGCDFVVLDIKGTVAGLHKEGMGKFLMVEPSLDQSLVRAINSLELDGVCVISKGEEPFVAVEHLLVYRRFVEVLEKPVIVVLPSLVSKIELTSLWQVGIDGVMTSSAQSATALAEVKKMISDLPRRPRGRRAKMGVALPGHGGLVAEEEDEEQEDV